MAKQIANGLVFVHGYNLSGDSNAASFEPSAEEKTCTPLDSTVVQRLPGLLDGSMGGAGYWNDTLAPDLALMDSIGLANVPVSVSTGLNVGATAYTLNAMNASYAPGMQVGEVFTFNWSAKATGTPIIRGTLMEAASTARTSSGTGTGLQLGAVTASQGMYAALHVTEVSGTAPSLTVQIASATANTFVGGTNRYSFSAANNIGSQYSGRVAGPVTDTWWRVAWTITGTAAPSFKFAVVFGWM